VKLKIFQEVSSVTRDKVLVQSADIITNKRTLESTVLIDSGQIVVLGGLIQDDQNAGQDKVPLLGDIPYLGALFRYETRNRKRTNLMIFLRPVVLKDDKAAASLTADRYEYIRGQQGGVKLPPSGHHAGGYVRPDAPARGAAGQAAPHAMRGKLMGSGCNFVNGRGMAGNSRPNWSLAP
jgi:general secretion pathway protein D